MAQRQEELLGKGVPQVPVTPDLPFPEQQYLTPTRRLLRRTWRNRGAMVGLTIVSVLALLAIFAPLIVTHDPDEQHIERRLEPPSRDYPLGTDFLGRDVMSRLIYGARPSLGTAAIATVLIMTIGVFIGTWAGYAGGLVDDLAMRVVDVFLAFPSLLLAIAIVGILGPGLSHVIIGTTCIWWASYARLVRGQVLEVRERPFVQSAVALGVGKLNIMVRHIIPNVISPVIVLGSLEMGTLILIIAGLNFLGLGVQPPTAEWGSMLNQGRPYLQLAPQLMIYPGAMISLAVLGFNLFGDGLRDVLDPRHVQ